MTKKNTKSESKSRVKPKPKPVVTRANKTLKAARETKRFFYVLAIATVLLVIFLYIIFVRK